MGHYACDMRPEWFRDDKNKDETKGLYRKYRVERLNDTSGKHTDCEYFVLDLNHDPHARAAMRAYAKSCEADFPKLSEELKAKCKKLKNTKKKS